MVGGGCGYWLREKQCLWPVLWRRSLRSAGGRSGKVFETVDIGGMFAHEIARLSTPILAHPPARAVPFLYSEGSLSPRGVTACMQEEELQMRGIVSSKLPAAKTEL
jgi:hypothetical protein